MVKALVNRLALRARVSFGARSGPMRSGESSMLQDGMKIMRAIE